MGPKKKKVVSSTNVETPKSPVLYDPGSHDTWIMLDFRLLNWKFMNFKMKFRDTTPIFTLKRILRDKHGECGDLKICFHNFTEANEITNEMLTLQQCGLVGTIPETHINAKGILEIDEKSIPVVQVFYDYKPSEYNDPVMLFFRRA